MIPYMSAPDPFGLQNNGVLCYFNSLIQCLLSCSAFNETIDDLNKKVEEYMNNDEEILTIEKYIKKSYEISKEYQQLREFVRENDVKSAYVLATLISKKRDQSHLQWNISPHRQEDIHEGFILMMEALSNQYDSIFSTRYALIIYCFECDHKIVVPKESSPTELVIEIPDANFTTQEQYENYIKSHRQAPEDYKCENCGIKNTPTKSSIYQNYKIARLSSVLILLLKGNQQQLYNHMSRRGQWFPQELEFTSMNGPLNYKLVAQAEQFGTLGGGHYTATCLRDQVYNFNDASVSPSGFNCTANTYMLFYHNY